MRWLVLLCVVAGCDAVFGIEAIDPLPDPLPVGPWRDAVVGDGHICALQLDDSLWCWGSNTKGELGIVDGAQLARPTRVDDAAWRLVAARGSTSCGIRHDASLWCWGANASGQVGDGTRAPARAAVAENLLVGARLAKLPVWTSRN